MPQLPWLCRSHPDRFNHRHNSQKQVVCADICEQFLKGTLKYQQSSSSSSIIINDNVFPRITYCTHASSQLKEMVLTPTPRLLLRLSTSFSTSDVLVSGLPSVNRYTASRSGWVKASWEKEHQVSYFVMERTFRY